MKDERIDESKYIDKKIQFYKGCLLGGALGDALGYPIEFRKLNEIKAKYGEDGLDHLVLADNGKALFSDDTQMTLFAANGLVAGHDRGLTRGVGGDPYWHTYYALEDWLTTQGYEKPRKLPTTSWLLQVKELHALRAPGNTCLSSLQAKEPGSVSNPLNDSKGCGAVMRIAPVGLFYAAMNDTAGFLRMTAELGAITHGHRMSHLSCMFVADLIRHALRMTVYEVEDYQYPYEAVEVTLADLERYYGEWTSTAKFCALIRRAMKLARSGKPAQECVRSLGEGWIAEEAVAIAVYAVLQSREMDCKETLVVAANHSGDSDSTAAIAGSIYGAMFGCYSLPIEWMKDLEIYDVIAQLAVDMAMRFPEGCSDRIQALDEYWSLSYKYEEMTLAPLDKLCLAKRRLELADDWKWKWSEVAEQRAPIELDYALAEIENALKEGKRSPEKALPKINAMIDKLYVKLEDACRFPTHNGMTSKEFAEMCRQFKAKGYSDTDILGSLYLLYQDGELSTEDLRQMLAILGYEFSPEFERMSEEDKHKKGLSWEDDTATK